MKDFFKYVLATVVGMLLFSIVMGVFMVMSMVGIVASGEQTKSIKDNSVLVLNLSGTLDERAQADPMAFIKGEDTEATGLDDMLTAIRKAKANDKVKGIYIEAGAFAADSYASLQAVRKALADFRSSGKWIVAYSDSYSQSTYYLASVANKVWVNPQGMIDWHGLASQKIYLKDLLEKVGVKMQVTKVGKYKSAVEMFTVDKMSDADREQTEAYINGIWKNVVNDVAASRHLTASQLNTYADSLITLAPATELVKMKMADQLLYTDQVKAEVKKLLKIDQKDEIYQLSVSDMANVKDERKEGDQVAVYYAFGDIVDGAAAGPTSLNESVIDAQKVCRDLEKLANDDDVKAVVVRVNSGGGSAYASEQIWHQVSELKKKKPVVVSMGGMAASGGYYMSAAANWIVAEPTNAATSPYAGSVSVETQVLVGLPVGTFQWDERYEVVRFEYDSSFTGRGLEPSPLMMPVREGRVYSFAGLDKETFKGLPGMLADSLPDTYGRALFDRWLALRQGAAAAIPLRRCVSLVNGAWGLWNLNRQWICPTIRTPNSRLTRWLAWRAALWLKSPRSALI